jgi:hypothetical protein
MNRFIEGETLDGRTVRLDEPVGSRIGTRVLVLPPLTGKLSLGALLRVLQLTNVYVLVAVIVAGIGAAFSAGYQIARLRHPTTEGARGRSLSEILLNGDGRYEWQWAGENWDAELVFAPVGQSLETSLTMDRTTKTFEQGNGDFSTKPLAATTRNGAVIPSADGNGFFIKGLDVTFEQFGGVAKKQNVTLTTDELRPVAAFVGHVQFATADKVTGGRIVLVNDRWKK